MTNQMTQFLKAKAGKITQTMRFVAQQEGVSARQLMLAIARGEVVIPTNKNHQGLKPVGIGKDLTVKINVNLGYSPNSIRGREKSGAKGSLKEELEKVSLCEKYEADTLMDLSIMANGGRQLDRFRRAIIKRTKMPVGTVPIYQVVAEKGILDWNLEDFLRVVERQAKDGVDFMTIHAGFLKRHLSLVEKRLTGVVSRGGGFLEKWMRAGSSEEQLVQSKNRLGRLDLRTVRENPLYTGFDQILEIARKYDVTMSLGDALRPGCLEDAGDKAQIGELKVLGELTLRCREAGVQVMIEGPGHVPLDQIEKQMKMQKKICHGAPFYVLGPLVTDVGAGYDHITGAIGGALAAWKGADFLCYVTPAEHLGLPDVEQVREGILAFKIAAHAADIARGNKVAKERDRQMSVFRKKLDWYEQGRRALDGEKVKEARRVSGECETCTMCGEFCPMKED